MHLGAQSSTQCDRRRAMNIAHTLNCELGSSQWNDTFQTPVRHEKSSPFPASREARTESEGGAIHVAHCNGTKTFRGRSNKSRVDARTQRNGTCFEFVTAAR